MYVDPVGDNKEKGFKLAEHLKIYEEKLGKKLSTLEDHWIKRKPISLKSRMLLYMRLVFQ